MREIFIRAGTALLSDIFDTMGLTPPILAVEFWPVPGPEPSFAGPAYTIRGRWQPWEGGGDREKLAAIDGIPEGAVPVWAGGDIHGVCCFGDLLAQAMNLRGAAGVVVDGGVRDLAFLKSLPMPIFTRYRTPAQAIGRWRVEGVGQEVALPGGLAPRVMVRPGDWVVGDEDGLLVIPRDLAEEVAQKAGEALEKESAAREAIRRGMSLLEALDTFGHL